MTRRKWITWASVVTALAALAAITGPQHVKIRPGAGWGAWDETPKQWRFPR